jgi:hypothetical protein
LYFGIQVKKGKLDSSGVTPKGNVNIAEIHHQALMMLGHEIFDDLRQALDAISHTRRGAHYVIEQLGDRDGVLIGDDTGFLKKDT